MAKNINKEAFVETTQLKLEIFGECFREWFPVFIYSPWVDRVYIYDFFAGSGKDKIGNYGSPLVLLNEAKGENRHFCGKGEKKPIIFSFNEALKTKADELDKNVSNHIINCENHNNCGGCIYETNISQSDFKSLFEKQETKNILENRKIGKFILLDQYGFSQIDDDIFQKLINYPYTDFIFFITSSFIKRFQEHPSVKTYINTEKINFDETKPKECHRVIADYFRQSIPKEKEYYLHHFTIQKESKGNYYGLIFGTNHTLGMEKFLKVCWLKDKLSGEANFNINNDFEPGTLFYDNSCSNKKTEVEEKLKNLILNEKIRDNITGLKYTLHRGCEPALFTNVVKRLEKENLIQRTGDVNNSSSNIHRVKKYLIQVN